MTKSPKISVVMSVYNGQDYVGGSIESILQQSFKNFEFIIINDGSTDNSRSIINSFNDSRIRLLNQKNCGLAASLNRGISISKSKIIARMDADDIADINRLSIQHKFLVENPAYSVVGSNVEIIDMKGEYIYTSNLPLTNDQIISNFPKVPLYHSSVLFRKGHFIKAGKYPEYMLIAQDQILFNRMKEFGKIHNIDVPLIKYRLVPYGNTSKNKLIINRINAIVENAIKDDHIKEEDKHFLKNVMRSRRSQDRLEDYYLFIAKKYLWNNYSPKDSRKNILNALRYNKLNLSSYFLHIISWLPKEIILIIYNKIKLLKKS
tara:strand:+ start:2027 stop:2983 length:957 start_codon:yes stop_codon:yes gene_type:complete